MTRRDGRLLNRPNVPLLFGCLAWIVATAVRGEVDLVSEGRAVAEIVLATNALQVVTLAAEDLQKHIELMSGAKLAIVNAPTKEVGGHVYVGESEFTRELGFKLGEFKNSGFRIVAKNDYVILAGMDIQRSPTRFSSQGEGLKQWQEFCGEKFGFGRGGEGKGDYNRLLKLFTNDDPGTWYAVAELLEQLGVRFYAPYENGTVIPERKTIAVAAQDFRKEAAFARREFCYYGTMREDGDGIAWFKRLKMGNHNIIIYNHTSDDVFASKEQKELHPEYLACDADGKPYSGYPDGHGMPRLSDPGFRKAAATYMNRTFDAIPDLQVMSVGVPDGGVTMDARDVPLYGKPTDSIAQKASQYVWDFHMVLCRELKKAHPDKYLLYFTGAGADELPENIVEFPDNLLVPIDASSAYMVLTNTAHAKHASRQEWFAKMKTVKKTPMWDYFLYYRTPEFPRYPVFFTESLQRDTQEMLPYCDGKFIEIQPGAYLVEGEKNPRSRLGVHGLVHLMVYWQGKLFWDPDMDRNAMLAEYYELFFGPARAEMKEFCEFAEAVWTRQESRSVTRTTGFLKEADVARYFEILQRARIKAGQGSVYDQRIALIEEEMQPLKMQFAAFHRTGPQVHAFTPASWGISAAPDGDLDSPFWRSVHWNWYTMRDVVTGESPNKNSTPVSLRMSGDKATLYIGVICNESRMDRLVAATERQDDQAIANDDTVEVYIATPERSYFKIAVNANGAIFDESTDVTIVDRDTLPILWNPGTKAIVRKYEDRWTVELAVPTKDLGTLGPNRAYPWGINVCRTRRAGGEPELFAVAPTGEPRFADLSKLADLAVGDVYRERLSDPAAGKGFAADFQSAKASFDRKEYSQSVTAFNQLADRAPTPNSRAACLAHAASSVSRQGQYEAALDLARRIEDGPLSIFKQMEIIAESKKHPELAAGFRGENIAAWPDDINYRGFALRGEALAQVGERDAAAADFEQSAALAGSDRFAKIELLYRAASLRHALKDDDRALAAYRQAFAVFEAYPQTKAEVRWLHPQIILGTTGILKERGEYDAALATLAQFGNPDGERPTGDWWCQILELYGDIYLLQGVESLALTRYRQASATGAQAAFTTRVNAKIEKLGVEQ